MFKMVCPGNANNVAHERLLLLRNATVNKGLVFNDVCDEKKVVVAYNEHHYFVDNYWKGWRHDNWEAEFGVDQITGQMRKYKDRYEQSHPSKGFQYPVSHEWEIQATFLNFTTSPPNG